MEFIKLLKTVKKCFSLTEKTSALTQEGEEFIDHVVGSNESNSTNRVKSE